MKGFRLYFVLVAAAGTAIETVAFLSRMWEFATPEGLVFQIFGFYGFIMGGLSMQLARQHPALRYLAGAAVGGLAEWANHWVLGAWSFPDGVVWGLAVPSPGFLALALAWGLIPLVAPWVVERFQPMT